MVVGASIHSAGNLKRPAATIKLLCSYGGRILPRHPDGKLRYHGGHTRLLAVDRSISYAELLVKLGEMCGTTSVSLRCQLPTEDLDALVSITSDEDLANLIEEYDRAASLKIRAFLSSPKQSLKKASPPPSSAASSTSSNDALSPKSICSTAATISSIYVSSSSSSSATGGCNFRQMSRPAMGFPLCYDKAAGKLPQYGYPGNCSNHMYLIHHGNHWQ